MIPKTTVIDESTRYINSIDSPFGEELDSGNEATFKQKLDQILSNGKVKRIIEIISLVLATASYILYIVSTYFPEHKFKWYIYTEFGVCTYFNLETLLNLYLAPGKS